MHDRLAFEIGFASRHAPRDRGRAGAAGALRQTYLLTAYDLLERSRFRWIAKRLYHVYIAGAERIPATGPVILVANHESMFDPWILALATPRKVRYMAKADLWRFRPVARILDSFGAFPVERGSGDMTALSRAAELLRDGEVVGMFPQGTSKPLPSRPYHRGAARLALVTGAPLVPVRLVGTRGFPHPRRPPAHVVVAEPIVVRPQKPTVVAARELTRRLERAIDEQAEVPLAELPPSPDVSPW